MKPERAFVIGKKPVDRILSIVHTIQSEYQSQLKETRRSIVRLEEQAKTASTEWQTERQRLQQKIATLEQAVATADARSAEQSANTKELEVKLAETIRSKADTDLQRVLADLNALEQSRSTDEIDRAPYGEIATVVRSEMRRIQLLINQIERTLGDSTIELSTEIRLRRERVELEAYLKGLRYSLGEVTPCLEAM